MRRTIHGRRFDTSTSTLIGSANVFAPDSSSWWKASLYVTLRSKRFFLAGRGGFMSRFRGEETIAELTHEDAIAWIEEYLGAAALDWETKEDIEAAQSSSSKSSLY